MDEVSELLFPERGRTTSVEVDEIGEEQQESEFQILEAPTEPPTELWHYTTADGLLGILGNVDESVPATKRLANTRAYRPIFRATMAEYLNDSRELIHGLEMVRAWLQQVSTRTHPPLAQKVRVFLTDLCDVIGQAADRDYLALLHCHVVSFSKRSDVLSQWRAYGRGTGGFAIGFDTRAFPRSDGSAMHRAGVGLHQVRYLDDGHLDQPLAAAVDVFISQVAADSARWPNKQPASRLNRALRSLGVVAASVKHPGFKEEEEWRFIEPAFLSPVQFRTGDVGLVPYRNVELGTDQCAASEAVVGVVVGPGPFQYENKLAAQSMLQLHGYFRAASNVTCSVTPFR